MYAIMATGGKQYSVKEGDIVKVEKILANADDTVKFDVLYVNDEGNVLAGSELNGAYVEAKVIGDGKGKKVIVYKYKSKKNIRRKQGHRQPYTAVQITKIVK